MRINTSRLRTRIVSHQASCFLNASRTNEEEAKVYRRWDRDTRRGPIADSGCVPVNRQTIERPETTRTRSGPTVTIVGDEHEKDRQKAETQKRNLIGTVQMRAFIVIQDNAIHANCASSRRANAPPCVRKVRSSRDGAGGFVEGNTLDAVHGKKIVAGPCARHPAR